MSDTVHETPGALEREFTPDVEPGHAAAPPPAEDVRLGGWTKARVGWTITAVVFLAWAVWAFIDDGTLFVALLGAGLAKGAIVSLAAIGFKGGLAMESFINMPPEVAYGLAVWRPVARDMEEVMGNGLPFLRNKAEQYGLI